VDEEADVQLQQELVESTQEEPESGASYRPPREDEDFHSSDKSIILPHNEDASPNNIPRFVYSPQLSFNSANDNLGSPAFRGLSPIRYRRPDTSEEDTQRSSQVAETDESWQAPPSEVPDSQPDMIRPIPAFSSPTTILEVYLQQFDSSPELSPLATRGSRRSRKNLSGDHVDSSQSESQLPSSPLRAVETPFAPISEKTSRDVVTSQAANTSAKRKWTPKFSEVLDNSQGEPVQSSSQSLPTEPRKRQRTEIACTDDEDTSRVIAETSSALSNPKTSFEQNSLPSSTVALEIFEALEVRPPPPRTANMELTPEKLITPSLLQIVTAMPIDKYFRPYFQAREIRPTERGHWLVNSGTWNEGLQRRCWNFLGKHIRQGGAGWGVWCTRDETFGNLRVYCWGHIVAHVYLLLLTATESKIRKTGADWIGGDGEALLKC